MNEVYKQTFGPYTTIHYFNPSQTLSKEDFHTLFQSLLRINADRSQPIKHKLLDPDLSFDAQQKAYKSAIVGILTLHDKPIGFLISPIIKQDGFSIVHSGLVVISSNYGENLLGLLSLGLAVFGQRKCPNTYITNISSTPSILEVFCKLVWQVWPSPDANLVKPPSGYRKVFELLYKEYILNYFPSPEGVTADSRRFIISSPSKEMGFNTNFRQLSRSGHMKYLTFCQAWIDYTKEEDVVQIGRLNWLVALKAYLITCYLKYIYYPRKNFSPYSLAVLTASKPSTKDKDKDNSTFPTSIGF